MHPDDDSDLRAAFAELRRQQQAEAPSIEVMRDRAGRVIGDEQILAARPARMPILRWAACAVAACGLAAAIWQLAPGSHPARPGTETSAAPVDQLIDRIEQHVEYHSAIALPDYPSDVLLNPDLISPL